ncbi:MAG: zinc ABC transporter substrate-binding protein [Chitinophagales bacterium]
MKKIIWINIWSMIACLLFVGCNSQDSTSTIEGQNKKWRIVTTTGMIKDAVTEIVGDKADVEGLMGAGVDPHLYKATQGDLKKLVNADIVFYNGLHLEGKMQDIFEKMAKQKEVIAIGDVLDKSELITSFDSGGAESRKTYDPHIWFSVPLWTQAVQHIGEKMQQIDQANAAYYQANLQGYLTKLGELNKIVAANIQTIPKDQRLLITSHDAFGYFGKTYDMEVKGLQGISTVAEFGLKDVTEMVNLIVTRKLKAIFIESSVAAKPLEAVVAGCKEHGHAVKIGGTLFSDAMGADGTKEGTYIGMVEYNTKTIVEALK